MHFFHWMLVMSLIQQTKVQHKTRVFIFKLDKNETSAGRLTWFGGGGGLDHLEH